MDLIFFFIAMFVICFTEMLVRAAWLAFKRRNNPTYPGHKYLDDGALAHEHSQGRLLDQPARDSMTYRIVLQNSRR